MIEVFKYTERLVNMIRPRKLLLMAIGRLCLPFEYARKSLLLPVVIRWRRTESQDEPTTQSSFSLGARRSH
jgi:hypothetical protein